MITRHKEAWATAMTEILNGEPAWKDVWDKVWESHPEQKPKLEHVSGTVEMEDFVIHPTQ